LNKEIFSF